MKNNTTIRYAKNHDSKQVFRFLCELEEQLFEQDAFEKNYGRCISGVNNIYLVAVDEKNMAVGFISCHGQILLHHGGMVYEIQEFFVAKEYRRKGVGRQLLKSLQEILHTKQYESFEVTANKKRVETIRFYKSNGFNETHRKLTKEKK
jgi:PhnO protein